MATTDKKEMWSQWTRDAMGRYSIPEDVDNTDELVDDMVEVTTKYADSMLDAFEERFEKRAPAASGRRRRSPEEAET